MDILKNWNLWNWTHLRQCLISHLGLGIRNLIFMTSHLTSSSYQENFRHENTHLLFFFCPCPPKSHQVWSKMFCRAQELNNDFQDKCGQAFMIVSISCCCESADEVLKLILKTENNPKINILKNCDFFGP